MYILTSLHNDSTNFALNNEERQHTTYPSNRPNKLSQKTKRRRARQANSHNGRRNNY